MACKKGKGIQSADSLSVDDEIRDIQQMWDATIEYFDQKLYDTDAMEEVKKRMSSRMTDQDISDVFSGVYADTYWDITAMNPKFLADSLRSALGIEKGRATKLAEQSLQQWRGIFLSQ